MNMVDRGSEYRAGADKPSAATLPTLTKRAHVRLFLPPSVRIYARVRHAGQGGLGARGMVSDISVGGMALSLTEGMRFELPGEGQEVMLELNHDGGEASIRGRVVRSSTQQLSVAFPPVNADRDVNGELLALIARVVTRQIDPIERAGLRPGPGVANRLRYQRFHGSGYLDVHVQTTAPAWWQIVFLDYMISWSEGDGVQTGTIDRSTTAQLQQNPLRVSTNLVRHPRPWTSLKEVAVLIASRCAASLPEHAGAFAAISRVL